MNTMTCLLRREFWEHKGSLLWAPLIVSALICFAIAIVLGFSLPVDGTNAIAHGALSGSDQAAKVAGFVSKGYAFISAPILMCFGFLVFFYCLGCLYDERRDRSILFWKSLPVSDGMTVLSKLATAAGVAPLIAIALASASSLLALTMFFAALAGKGTNLFGTLFATPALYLTPILIAGLIPVYLLWALPTIGWLMMVSAWARSKAFLWAVGIPLLSAAMLIWVRSLFLFQWDIGWYLKNILGRILLGLVPGAWIAFDGLDKEQLFNRSSPGSEMLSLFTQSWGTLASPGLWIGVVAGLSMIYLAILARRWREDY